MENLLENVSTGIQVELVKTTAVKSKGNSFFYLIQGREAVAQLASCPWIFCCSIYTNSMYRPAQ